MRNWKPRILAVPLSAAAMALAMFPSMALAHTEVTQGRDIALERDQRFEIVCDREADGHTVYAVAELANGNRKVVVDVDGAGGYCYRNADRFGSDIKRHKVCETRSGADICSAWKRTGH